MKKIAKIAVVLIIFYFLGRNLHRNWGQIDFRQLHFDVPLLIVSILFLFLFFLLFVLGWKLILRGLGVSLSFLKGLKIIFYSQLGKYLPGKIWTIAGRMYFCQQLGVPTSKTFLSMVLEMALAITSGILIFLLGLAIFPKFQIHIKPFFLITVVIVLFIIVHPKVFTRMVNIFLQLVKKGPIRIDLSFSQICAIMLYYCLMWLSLGIGFYFLINSTSSIALSTIPILAGSFSISTTIGAMALFVPGGLGVRESVLALLLSNFFPISLAILISVLSRIWVSFGELILAGISTRIKL